LEKDEIFDVETLLASKSSFAGRLKFWTNELCERRPQTFDIVIAVSALTVHNMNRFTNYAQLGGDGTVLYASWLFQRVVPPVLAFAMGSLGFLTRFDFDGYREILTKAFEDGITISLRLRFEATVMRSQHWNSGMKNKDLVEELIGDEKTITPTNRTACTTS